MDINSFQPNAPGKLIPITGIPSATHAFLPDPLPPQWEFPSRLVPLLVKARTALAELDGTGSHLPDPNVLLRPLQNREAQKSSSLEGTYTEPEQQLLFQLNPQEPNSANDPINAYREVFNYGRALRLRMESPDRLPLSLRLIRDLHRTLLYGVRGSDRDPGEFRRLPNQVGRPARYIPPPPDRLPECLHSFEKYLHTPTQYDPLVNAFLTHYQFEAIHPFMDGNGRVGRLLLAITIMEWCELSSQWLYMSAYFDANKDKYIDLLLRISTHSAWEEWIEFCLQGVRAQSSDALDRCRRLLALRDDYDKRILSTKGSARLQPIAHGLFVHPIVSPSSLARKLNVTYPTARADIDRLVKAGILTQLPNTSPMTFYAPALFNITFSDSDVHSD
jgi:Fic family protein